MLLDLLGIRRTKRADWRNYVTLHESEMLYKIPRLYKSTSLFKYFKMYQF